MADAAVGGDAHEYGGVVGVELPFVLQLEFEFSDGVAACLVEGCGGHDRGQMRRRAKSR